MSLCRHVCLLLVSNESGLSRIFRRNELFDVRFHNKSSSSTRARAHANIYPVFTLITQCTLQVTKPTNSQVKSTLVCKHVISVQRVSSLP